MYGKVFASIYDGTLAGHWQAIVTMQQLIVLADADGVIDMTAEAISRRTTIPLRIIAAGLEHLAKPDPYSRTPGEDGRRIVCIDEHRPWGWSIVNYSKYKHLKDSDEVRTQTRERVRRFREKRDGEKRDVTHVTLGNAEKRHTDIDTKTPLPPSGAFLRFWTAWPKSPRKRSQGECYAKWRKQGCDAIAEQILAHLEAMKLSIDWRKEAGAFIPAPLVYLNKRYWEGADLLSAEPEKRMVM